MKNKKKLLKNIIAVAVVFALTVTLFAPAVYAEDSTPSMPDISSYSYIYIDGIQPETTVSTFKANTTLSDTETLSVWNTR